jgi:BCD family chlorophyll transporter-like MFS transporter
MSGVIRDVVNAVEASGVAGVSNTASASGYMAVYAIEIGLLIVTLIIIAPLMSRMGTGRDQAVSESEG